MLYKANKVRQTIQQWYYFYELNTNLCMLEPWEKTLFNTLLASFTLMSCYTTCVYLPKYTLSGLQYFGVL